jgi:hypothetical protein
MGPVAAEAFGIECDVAGGRALEAVDKAVNAAGLCA